jgi:flavodoxin
MKGAIYYYTGTGNTELACCSIAENINHIDFDLIDITTSKNTNLSKYEVVGFASPTFYMGIPKVFKDFLFSIKEQDKKPAFILNTFGMMQGSYPVFIAKGWGEVNRPNEQQVHDFQSFITDLSSKLGNLKRDGKT